MADHKAGRVLTALSKRDNGTFDNNTKVALEEWLLVKSWNHLNDKTLLGFKRKVRRLAKKNWPHGLPREVCINGYFIIILCIRVMSLRGQVGNGPRVQNGGWVGSSATFIACLREFIRLLEGMVNVRGSSVKAITAGLFINITFSIVRAQLETVSSSKKRF